MRSIACDGRSFTPLSEPALFTQAMAACQFPLPPKFETPAPPTPYVPPDPFVLVGTLPGDIVPK